MLDRGCLEADGREGERRHLHVVVRVHLGGGDVEPGLHAVEDLPHHLPLVLQRAAFADEQPDFESADTIEIR